MLLEDRILLQAESIQSDMGFLPRLLGIWPCLSPDVSVEPVSWVDVDDPEVGVDVGVGVVGVGRLVVGEGGM